METAVKASPEALKGVMIQLTFAKSLHVAAELGIADILGEETLSIEALAEKTQSRPDALFRILRNLAAHGVFHVTSKAHISNNEQSQFLRDNVEGSVRNFVRMMTSEWMFQSINHMPHAVKTGEPGFSAAYPEHQNLYEYFQEHPKDGHIFSQAMSDFSRAADWPITEAFNFGQFDRILDVGGAEGHLLKTIHTRYPSVQPVLFDLPYAIEQAQKQPYAHKLEHIPGDFFKPLETHADAVLLKYVLHNWSDEKSVEILKNIRPALGQNGRIFVIENMIDNAKPQVMQKSLDVVMLTALASKERTREEFTTVFNAAGFELVAVHPTETTLFILEAKPI